mmetsp:Transcript_32178/g.53832  ORF Transcript_32178/g.53832 Transcript_32178/m.53832 type:complete len:200 (-) Transcript_32178:644-1243(-)
MTSPRMLFKSWMPTCLLFSLGTSIGSILLSVTEWRPFLNSATLEILNVLRHGFGLTLGQVTGIWNGITHRNPRFFVGEKPSHSHCFQLIYFCFSSLSSSGTCGDAQESRETRRGSTSVPVVKHFLSMISICHTVVPSKEIYIHTKYLLPTHGNFTRRAGTTHCVVAANELNANRPKDIFQISLQESCVSLVKEIPMPCC